MTARHNPPGSFLALALIVAGALLFLDNLGILPVDNIGAYWPLGLVLYGLGVIYRRRTAVAAVWSAALIIAGVLLILGNLHILRITAALLWPLLLIALGAAMLVDPARWLAGPIAHMQELRARRRQWRQWRGNAFSGDYMTNPAPAQPDYPESRIDEAAVFFSLKRRVESMEFRRGELASIFGSIELDLSEAKIALALPSENGAPAKRRAVVEASAVFGSIEITVPRDWRIVKMGTGVFGSFEDKTINSRREPGVDPSTLVLRGGAVFGSVTVRN